MNNYFRGNSEHPYHLSVGAVIVNNKNEICCHYFEKNTDHTAFKGFTDFYLLMRETMELGETVEDTLHRGMMEEFGITGEIVSYLGSIKSEYEARNSNPSVMIEKTTLYFQVSLTTFNPDKRSSEDIQNQAKIEWHSADFLISHMKEWGKRYKNTTLDESSILERVKLYI